MIPRDGVFKHNEYMKTLIIGCLVILSLSSQAEGPSVRDKVLETGKKTSNELGKSVQKIRSSICGDGKSTVATPLERSR
jgi:hypothetical protein